MRWRRCSGGVRDADAAAVVPPLHPTLPGKHGKTRSGSVIPYKHEHKCTGRESGRGGGEGRGRRRRSAHYNLFSHFSINITTDIWSVCSKEPRRRRRSER